MKRLWLPYLLLVILFALAAVSCREHRVAPPPTPTGGQATVTAAASATPTPTAAKPSAPTVRVDDAIDLDSHPAVAPFVLHFNQPMAKIGSRRPLSFSPDVKGELRWNKSFTTLTFVPGDSFRPGRRYVVTLDEALATAAGQSFAEMPEWRLRIRPAPRLSHRTPAVRALGDRRPLIELSFSRPMARSRVVAALAVDPALPLDFTWEGERLQIMPMEPLAFGTTYAFTLDQTATDRDGVPLARHYEWSYRLRDLVRRMSGPSRAKPEHPVHIVFNYALEPARFEAVAEFDPPLAGTYTWNEEKTAVTFTPEGRLPANRRYTLTFAGPLHDTSGATLPPPADLSFTTPPPILSNGPEGGDVNPATAVRVRFDRPMDRPTTAGAFRLEPKVPGEIVWEETTLIFRPASGYLDEQVTYRVQIGPDATGADGERVLDDAFSWSFTTGPLRDLADFGWGPNAQVLDASGRRAVHFNAHTPDALLEFELYELTLTQFLDRYASGFRGVAGWEPEELPPISTEGAPLVASWFVDGALPGSLQEVIVPDAVPPGLYLLNLVAGHVNDQLILVVTGNTLLVKQAGTQLVAWVTDINGEPAPGAAVEVYARNGRRLAEGSADADGVLRTTLPAYESGGPASTEPLIVVARQGSDLTVSGLSPEWSVDGWWGWWRPQPPAPDYAVYAYTERPIYKPGQAVYFKAIVRRNEDAVLSTVAAGMPVVARLRDARNNLVQATTLETNEFGTIAGEFMLAEGAMLGEYHVEIVVAGENYRQPFKVEDYRKPEYEVTVTTDAEQFVIGEEIEIVVEARYFFGEPVAHARVDLNRFHVGENYGGTELPGDTVWYRGGSLPGGRTDARGRFTTTVKAEVAEDYGAYGRQSSLKKTRWVFEATLAGEGNQSVSSAATATVFDALEAVTLDANGYVHAPGDAFAVEAEVRDIYGEPVGGRALTVELLRWNRASSGYDKVVQTATITTEGDGEGRALITIAEPGYYHLSVGGEDARGNEIGYTTSVFAFSDWASTWYGRGGALTIDADQESYAPGDSARLLIESTFSGPALLTFERGTTRREQVIRLEAPLTIVEVPIEAQDVPNIHVTVNAWQEQNTAVSAEAYQSVPDSRLQRASVNLSVPATHQRLQVTITPDKETYVPREDASVTVTVTDHRGEPVVAEFSLALVDEAIYALSPELVGPIYEGFYYERENRVTSYNSLQPTRFLNWGGRGGGGGGADVGNPRVDFPDTAAWFPRLRTDADGRATVSLALPDTLTTWRLTVRVTSADTQVGEATAELSTRQEIVVRPLLPRILTAGDTVELAALVHNYGEGAMALAVSIGGPGIGAEAVQVETPLTRTVTLQPGEVRVVGWSAVARAAGEAEILVAAQPVEGREGATTRGDAVQLKLPVQPLAVPDVETEVGQFTGSVATTIAMPAAALPMSRVEIQLSRSVAGTLLNGLEYLTGFPYGCVEQTMSKALPNAVVGRAFNQLGVGSPTLQADLPPQIYASLQRLYGYQHNDGGWGWWYDDPSHDYQTAWVLFGLAVTAQAGYQVDDGVVQRGALWLEQHLGEMDLRTRAFALYGLALSQEMVARAETTNAAIERESWQEAPAEVDYAQVVAEALGLRRAPGRLDTFSRAALALALYQLGEERAARDMVEGLAADVTLRGDGAYWTGEDHDGKYYQKTMASDVRNSALALSALATVQPDLALQEQVVSWLMDQRRQQGWGTTNETSFAIVGLTDHLLATGAGEGGTQTGYRLVLNGTEIAAGQLGPGEPSVSVTVPREQLAAGENRLTLYQEGSGRLYYVVNSRVFRPLPEVAAAGAITLRRTYHDPESGARLREIAPEQLVEVQLTVTLPEDGSYMIVEDKLPGGFEALNERLNTTSHVARLYGGEPDYRWQAYGYNHKEVFGDRVSFFITEMDAGRHTFTYYARATHAGTFTAMPAEAYAMYDLAQWGRSASEEVQIGPIRE